MKLIVPAVGALLVLSGCATGPRGPGHAAHHPAGAAAGAPSAPTTGQMDSTMKSMQEMHDKVMAAKTPEERAALMKDHMKSMQDGMAMMGRMRGGPSTSPEMMGKRMDMMETMMQMMMDREAMRPPAVK